MSAEPLILLAEDDDGHARLLEINLLAAGVEYPLRRFFDGCDLLDFLTQTPPSANPPSDNYLVFLDIDMPHLSGLEVLARLRDTPRLAKIPVLILTTTDDPATLLACRDLGCADILAKPPAPHAIRQAMRNLGFPLDLHQKYQ